MRNGKGKDNKVVYNSVRKLRQASTIAARPRLPRQAAGEFSPFNPVAYPSLRPSLGTQDVSQALSRRRVVVTKGFGLQRVLGDELVFRTRHLPPSGKQAASWPWQRGLSPFLSANQAEHLGSKEAGLLRGIFLHAPSARRAAAKMSATAVASDVCRRIGLRLRIPSLVDRRAERRL